MTPTPDVQSIILDLTPPQRRLILSSDSDHVEAGMGTWMTLRHKGLLTDDFDLTGLGHRVRDALLTEPVAEGE